MQIILDHLASIFVSAAILLIIVFIQMRGTLGAAESTINHMVYSESINVNRMLERDLENMLNAVQVDSASTITGGTGACNLITGGGRVQSFTFPTVADPDNSINATGNPSTMAAIEVRYTLEASGDSALVPTGGVDQWLPLFTLQRYVGTSLTASSLPYVTNFDVRLGFQDSTFVPSTLVPNTTTPCGTAAAGTGLTKVRYDFKLVANGLDFVSRNQRSTSQLNITRFGSTVNLSNWE